MTDNNAAKPAETAAGEKKVGPIRQWIKDHPNIWEFILFNVLSNISTITRFVVTWIGTAIFISGLGLTQPFHFLIFNYDTKGNGLGGFLTFLLAEVLARLPRPEPVLTVKVSGSDVRLCYRDIISVEHSAHPINIRTTALKLFFLHI